MDDLVVAIPVTPEGEQTADAGAAPQATHEHNPRSHAVQREIG